MKIGINAFFLNLPEHGFGKYTIKLLELLKRDRDEEYFLFMPLPVEQKLVNELNLPDNFRYISLRPELYEGDRIRWERGFVNDKEFSSKKLDLLYIPYASVPDVEDDDLKVVPTFHDIIPLAPAMLDKVFHQPRLLKLFSYPAYKETKRELNRIDKAHHVLTVSYFSKRDLVKVSGADEDKFSVIYNWINPHYYKRDSAEIAAKMKKYAFEGKYIFYLGGLTYRKNVISLMKAYSKLSDELKNEYKLVISSKLPDNSVYSRWMKRHPTERENIRFIGFVDEADLPALYSGASLFSSLSMYEGFGVPPLEALACETPVVASKIDAHKEVLGNAALLVDPFITSETTSALTKALADEKLRKRLIDKGKERVRFFSSDNVFKALKSALKNDETISY